MTGRTFIYRYSETRSDSSGLRGAESPKTEKDVWPFISAKLSVWRRTRLSMEAGRNNWEHSRGDLCMSGRGQHFVILLSWCGVGFYREGQKLEVLGRNKNSCAKIKGVVLQERA